MGCHLGGPMVGLMGPPPWGLMPRAGWPRSAATRAPAHAAGHCRPVPLQQTLKHSKEYLAQSLCGLWPLLCTRAAWALLACLAYRGFESQCNFHPPPPSCWAFSFTLWHGESFSGGIQHSLSRVVQLWAAVLEFLQEKWAQILLLHHLASCICMVYWSLIMYLQKVNSGRNAKIQTIRLESCLYTRCEKQRG